MLHALIMAGGGGTRFWPRSRRQKPKQFLSLTGERSLLQETVDRIEAQIPLAHTWIITGATHGEQAQQQLPHLPANRIIGEPVGRDTAACIGLGAALIAREDPDATMIVMPADHVIEPVQEFRRAIHAAEQVAHEYPHALITFGIAPTFASINYGYIHRGAHITQRQGIHVHRVEDFREKPSLELAEQYLASGEYYWNSGIFVWKVQTILEQLRQQRPSLAGAMQRVADAWTTPGAQEIFRQEYEHVEKISIDYAVMEDASDVLVIEAPYQWDDVGSWLALERRKPQDAHGNTIQGRHCGLHTHDCVIVSDNHHLIATIGVSNLLIVQDGNATLIADRRDEAAVKQLVERLRQAGLEEYL